MKTKILILAFFVLLLGVFNCGKKEQTPPSSSFQWDLKDQGEKVKSEMGIELAEGALCKAVTDRKPVDICTNFQTDQYVDAYLFTRIRCKKPGFNIYHRYSFLRKVLSDKPGLWEEVHTSELSIQSTNYRTWSYKTVYPGWWRVDVLAPDKESIMRSYVFEVRSQRTEEPSKEADLTYDLSQLTLVDSALCEKVVDNKPVNPSSVFSLTNSELTRDVWAWLYLKAGKFPVKVFLRWSRKMVSVDKEEDWVQEVLFPLDVKGATWHTRAYKSCTAGSWRVDILGPDARTILKSLEFEVKKGESI